MEYAAKLGIADQVLFLGFRSDVLDLIRISDVVVLPSHAEGMPMSILEVGACAKPIVAYRIPGVDEVVEDEKTGFLTPENDIMGLAQAVKRLLVNPELKEKIGQSARRHIEGNFTLKRYTQSVEVLYDALFESNRAGL